MRELGGWGGGGGGGRGGRAGETPKRGGEWDSGRLDHWGSTLLDDRPPTRWDRGMALKQHHNTLRRR